MTPSISPADVVILTGEDGLSDTIQPRLQAAGADLTRIHSLEGARYETGVESITLPEDVPVLERLVERHRARLVIIDVLNAFLSGAVDSYRDHDIRRALCPRKELAERTSAAVVCVRHLRKSGSARAIAAGGGSIGIGGAARSVLVVDLDPNNPDRRVLASVKSNLAAPASSLSFTIAAGEWGSENRVAG